jgi:hypothetical protein
MHAILVKYVVRVIAYSYQGSGLEMPLASISGGRGKPALVDPIPVVITDLGPML